MAKGRSAESMLTKLENMNVGDQIWTKKSNGYMSDIINTITKRHPTRKYKQTSVYTHLSPTFSRLEDFEKIIFISRIS